MKNNIKFVLGYKGKGMCQHCNFSIHQVVYKERLSCKWYESACKLVSRNCLGIRSLK